MKTKTTPTKKTTKTGTTILKSSIELNDISFEMNSIYNPSPFGKEAEFEQKPFLKNVFKIKRLRIEMETTDQVSVEYMASIVQLLNSGRF